MIPVREKSTIFEGKQKTFSTITKSVIESDGGKKG